MAEYIKREELKEMLRREWTKHVPMELDPSIAYVLAKIDELPSVDIVRCKDCKYYSDCCRVVEFNKWGDYLKSIDYCSYGERKDETD